MKFRFLFLFIILTKLSVSLAGDARRMMIIFDPEDYEGYNKESTVCLGELVKGINEQCSPIVVSKSTWNNFIERRHDMNMIISKGKDYVYRLFDWKEQERAEQQDHTPLQQAITNINNVFLEVQKDINAAADKVSFDNQGNLQEIKDPLEQKIRSRIREIRTIEAALEQSGYKDRMHKIRDNFICYLTPFNEKDWIVKLHENDLVILIPYRYYEQCKRLQTEGFKKIAQQFITSQPTYLTMDELILGIKINHLKTMDRPLGITTSETSEGFSAIKAFNDIFVTRSDLNLLTLKSKANSTAQNMDTYEQLLHPWYFYMVGHGKTAEKIVGLPIVEFKKVLQFFNIQIYTRFLFYDTCFSGGANMQEVFEYAQRSGREIAEDAVQWIQEEFNYTIAAGTSLDAATYNPAFTFKNFSIMRRNGEIIVVPGQVQETRICRFFEKLSVYFGDSVSATQENSISNIIEDMHPFKTKEVNFVRYYNTPMIRFAHTPWFFVDNADKEVMSITPIKVKIAIANKQSIIIKDKKIVFLADPFIPLTIIIEGEMPTFLFALAGEVNVHIDNVKALGKTIYSFVRSFSLASDYAYTKSCTINKLVLGTQADQMFQHVLMRNDPRGVSSVAYAERMDGAFYILKTSEYGIPVAELITKEELSQPEQMKKLKMYANEYEQLASTEAVPVPEIEEGIEYQSLEEYSAEPVAKLLQKRLERKKAEELRKKLLEQAWKQYAQKKQQEPQTKLKIEELD